MLNSCNDLLRYISDNNGYILLSDALPAAIEIDRNTLQEYFCELEDKGYIKRNIRGYAITPAGKFYLSEG